MLNLLKRKEVPEPEISEQEVEEVKSLLGEPFDFSGTLIQSPSPSGIMQSLGYNFTLSYDQEFVEFFAKLKSKYPNKLFDIEGIGKQLDFAQFSRDFFSTKTNVADVSVDANANVDEMSVVAYQVEAPKPLFRINALYLLWKYGRQLYGTTEAEAIVEGQITGDYYINDLAGISLPYCFNFSTYDIAIQGLPFVKKIESGPPKHLSSFMGQIIHFTSYASNNIMGAVGLADLLIVMAYYVDKLHEDNPYKNHRYFWKAVKQELQGFIFSCNQPFRAGVQSGFYNISIFDTIFLEKLIPDYVFEDGVTPKLETVLILQNMYLDLMNETLSQTPITFPVTTGCFVAEEIDGKRSVADKEYHKFIIEKNLNFGFINFYYGKTSTLSSCCRLRSNVENEYFNSFGSGSSKIGSLGVATINLPRLAFKCETEEQYFIALEELSERVVKINNIKRFLLKKRIKNHNLPLYDYGFMDIGKQYSTTGVNGINEAVEAMGLDILTPEGQVFTNKLLNLINVVNEKAEKRYKAPHNMEQTPSENSAVKLAEKDRILSFQNKHVIYSNQFIPLTTNADLLDRIKLQGLFDKSMSGGAICHLNIEQKIDNVEAEEALLNYAVDQGVIYLAVNHTLLECENKHMTVGKTDTCSICQGQIVNEFTRVVGFLTAKKNWNYVRKEIEGPNRIFYNL